MRKCRTCKVPIPTFAKSDTVYQKRGCCGEQCALAFGRLAIQKSHRRKERENVKAARVAKGEQRKQRTEQQIKLKTRTEWIKEAQVAFNKFIRLRDDLLPCICCNSWGKDEDWLVGGKWDAGHFLSRGGFPELRFEELNCHKQLKSCNAGSSKYARKGRTVSEGYRLNLINKIGLDKVEWLESHHEEKKYTIDDLKQIITVYKAKLAELKPRQPAD
jgi:hypothetical protein